MARVALKSRSLAMAGGFVVLSGCAPLSQSQQIPEAVGESDPRVGSRVSITAPINVAAGQIDSWFSPLSAAAARPSVSAFFGPNPQKNGLKCGLRLARPVPWSSGDFSVEPGDFSVTKIVRESEPLGIDPSRVSMHGGFDSDVTLNYRIAIHSPEQPQVAALFCSQRHPMLSRGTAFPQWSDLQIQSAELLDWQPRDLPQ